VSEKFSIEIDSDFLKKFFELADMPVPKEVELEKLNNVVEVVKGKLDAITSLVNVSAKDSGNTPALQTNSAKIIDDCPRLKTVLVVDDLGIVTIQLESVLKKLGFEVTVSRELFDAIEKFKAKDFGYTITDLFIPTEREGYILIDEIKKLSLLCKLNTKIIVMSASNKKEHKDSCMNRGAKHYVEKAQGWQQRIAEICTEQAD